MQNLIFSIPFRDLLGKINQKLHCGIKKSSKLERILGKVYYVFILFKSLKSLSDNQERTPNGKTPMLTESLST